MVDGGIFEGPSRFVPVDQLQFEDAMLEIDPCRQILLKQYDGLIVQPPVSATGIVPIPVDVGVLVASGLCVRINYF